MQSQSTLEKKGNRYTHSVDLFLIFLGSFFLLLPIFLSPHFGLFSDYIQILTVPPAFLKGACKIINILGPMSDGRWIPLFHLGNIIAYRFFGPAPLFYYLVQWALLLIILFSAYQIALLLSGNLRLAGWTSCLLILLSDPLFENFFTLDKVEPRLAVSTLVSFSLLIWSIYHPPVKNRFFYYSWIFLLQFFLVSLSIFSKETAVFLLPVALIVVFVSFFIKKRADLLISLLLFAGAVFISYFSYRFLKQFLMTEEIRQALAASSGGQYISYKINGKLIHENWNAYFKSLPETFISGFFLIGWFLHQFFTGRIKDWDKKEIAVFLLSIAGLIYLGGLLLWRWSCSYYMLLPVVFFSIAIAALCFNSSISIPFLPRLKVGFLAVTILLIVVGTQLKHRWYTGEAILAQDKAKDDLVAALNHDVLDHPQVIPAFFKSGAIEIGISLKSYLNFSGLKSPVTNFNFIEGPWVNFYDFNRFNDSPTQPPLLSEVVEASKLDAPFVLWKYLEGGKKGSVWTSAPLQPGDIVLIMVGSPDNYKIKARGISSYSLSSEDYFETWFRGVKFKIRNRIREELPGHHFLGWDVAEVVSIDTNPTPDFNGLNLDAQGRPYSEFKPNQIYLGDQWRGLSWDKTNNPARWAMNRAQIFLPASRGAKTMVLSLERNKRLFSGKPIPLEMVDDQGKLLASWLISNCEFTKVSIPDYNGKDVTLYLQIPSRFPVPSDQLLVRLGTIGWSDDSWLYDSEHLNWLNPQIDITRNEKNLASPDQNQKPLQLGYGWGEVEKERKKETFFRRVGKEAEVLVECPHQSVALSFEITPIDLHGKPLKLQLKNDTGTVIAEKEISKSETWKTPLPVTASSYEKYHLILEENLSADQSARSIKVYGIYLETADSKKDAI